MEKKVRVLEILTLVFFGLSMFYIFRYYGSDENAKLKTKDSKELTALEVIHQRKSVRKYVENKPVSDSLLNIVVRAGMAAPSARNVQPWEFIVITDRNVLDSLSSQLPYGKMLTTAPAAIVVCGNIGVYDSEAASKYWEQDCTAATENILLAIEAIGLGGVWIGTYPDPDRSLWVSSVLELPSNVLPLSVISLGYPTGIEKPKDKYKPEKIHYNRY